MTGIYADRVKETAFSTGTGPIVLNGAANGFQSFNAAFGVGPPFAYAITQEAYGGVQWEVGQGHLSASNILVRDTVLASSAAGSLVNLTGQQYDVFCSLPASGALTPAIASTYVYLQSGATGSIAASNTSAIQSALNNAGNVVIAQPGTYNYVPPLVISSNTRLTLGPNVRMTAKPVSSAASSPCFVSSQYIRLQTPTTVTFTWSAGNITATINWTSHGLAVGDYVLTQGASPTEFNTVAQVISVTNANAAVLMLYRIPQSAPSGTIVAVKCDQNVIVEGGTWDYGAGNTNPTGALQFGAIMMGQNVTVRDVTFLNCNAQCIVFAGARDYKLLRFNSPNTPSGTLQVHGPSFVGEINGTSVGNSNDDGIATSCAATTGFASYQVSTGDICGLRILDTDIYSAHSQVGLVTIYPTQNERTSGIYIRGVHGRSASGQAVKLFAYNAGLATTIDDIVIEDVDACCLESLSLRIASATSMTIRSLIARGIKLNPEANGSMAFYSHSTGQIVVETADVEVLQNNPSWPTTGQGYLMQHNAIFRDARFKFVVSNGGSSGAGNVRPLYMTGNAANLGSVITIYDSYFSACVDAVVTTDGSLTDRGQIIFEHNSFVGAVSILNTTMVGRVSFVGGNEFYGATTAIVKLGSGSVAGVYSDGLNRLDAASVWLSLTSATAACYGQDITADAGLLATTKGQYFYHSSAIAGRNAANQQGPCVAVDGTHFYALATGAGGVNTLIV